MTIEEELRSLDSQRNKLSLFHKKSETISRLKLSFFKKMKAAEEVEDIIEAKKYYSYLIRTMNLSEKVYNRMNEEIKNFMSSYSYQSIEKSEINEISRGFNLESVRIFQQNFLSLHVSIDSYQQSLASFFKDFQDPQDNLIYKILTIINQQKEFFNDIEDYHSDLFKKLQDQKMLHVLLEQEKEVSDLFLKKIEFVEQQTTSLAKTLSNKLQDFQNSIQLMIREVRKDPKLAVSFPYHKLEHIFHKHASIIALTIIGLGVVANLSTLAGIGTIGVVARTAMGLLSHTMEGVEALPSLEKIANNSKNFISSTINSVQASIERINKL